MIRILTLIIFIFASQSAWSQRFQPIQHSIGNAEKIVVRGYKGALQIVPSEGETVLVEAQKKGGDGWNFEVSQKLNVLEIRVKAPSEQEAWEKLRAGGDVPEFEMKITAPLRPMEIFWQEGQVFADKWGSSLSLQMTRGKTKITGGTGSLRIQVIDGKVEVSEQTGNIALQTYKGQVLLSKNKGSLNLTNHSALYTVEEQDGVVDYRNHSGTSNFKKIAGNMDVKNVSGAIRLSEFSGSLSGEFSKGSLDAKFKSLSNFNVTSDEANITLDVPEDSGALVHLRSEKGRLWAPIHLQKLKKARWEERKGRLKGEEQGNIKIVSKYGDIMLK